MPCYHPMQGYRSIDRTPSGKRTIVFNPSRGYKDLPVTIPCGQCIGCRLERSRQWAIRITHEAQLHKENSFITLTYAPEHLPEDNSLHVQDFQLFMKRFRKKIKKPVRFFHCGEYGERNGRPHYHACIFGYDFPDKVLSPNDRRPQQLKDLNPLYESPLLDATWGLGISTIGTLTFDSAAYVARYITKKITGEMAEKHYSAISADTGEIFQLKPEYTTMSRRPGIGKPWLEKFLTDVYPDDFIVLRNKKMRPPKFYDSQFEILYPEDHAKLKEKRKQNAAVHKENNTWERLKVRETLQNIKATLLKRSYENEV